MSRYSMQRPNYREGPDPWAIGLSAALEGFMRGKDEVRDFRNRAAEMGAETFKGPSLWERFKDKITTGPTSGARPSATPVSQAGVVDPTNTPRHEGLRGFRDPGAGIKGGPGLQSRSPDIWGEVVPEIAPLPGPSIGSQIDERILEGPGRWKARYDANAPARRSADFEDRRKEREIQRTVEAAVRAGMPRHEAEVRARTNTFQYDDQFGRQPGRGGSTQTHEQKLELENLRQRHRVALQQMRDAAMGDRASGRAALSGTQLEMRIREARVGAARDLARAEQVAKGLEATIQQSTPEGRAQYEQDLREANAAVAELRKIIADNDKAYSDMLRGVTTRPAPAPGGARTPAPTPTGRSGAPGATTTPSRVPPMTDADADALIEAFPQGAREDDAAYMARIKKEWAKKNQGRR